jgi:uncharacterized protein (DUF885 family)
MTGARVRAAETFSTRDAAAYVPDVAALATPESSELREMVERYSEDRSRLRRFLSVRASDGYDRAMRGFNETWGKRLSEVSMPHLGVEGCIDYVLLRSEIAHELRLEEREKARVQEIAPLLPVGEGIAELQASRRLIERIDSKNAAAKLADLSKHLADAHKALEAGLAKEAPAGVTPSRPSKITALRAASRADELSRVLDNWFEFYNGYDPEFSWWVHEPYSKLSEALKSQKKFLREKIVGVKQGEDEPIVGDPIGRDGLLEELEHEFIAYTPEELIEIANREFAFCDAEWRRTARELGLGDDWKAALEKSKNDYVPPGRQPELVRDLAREMIDYVEKNDLITVPPMAAETWRMRMMTPAEQKVNPFFLGGESIIVSFPTAEMSNQDKLGSLRANNIHIARATVFHELIPGHSLQDFMTRRYQPHRELFSTPFWVEGWSLWWEFQMYDRGYTSKDPLDRAGALFWRAHRCARIIFSLNFHLGKWTPQQCIDFLVDRVGHDRHTATGEVRRSFNGNYSPLYQAGYMIGALQLRALHKELVESGKMKVRDFHDRIMQGGPMPIELVRARLRGDKLPANYKANWRFAD